MNIRGMWNKLRQLLNTDGWQREQSKLWANRHFPDDRQEAAAAAARHIIIQIGIPFDSLLPSSRFIEDLAMDDFEGVELVMGLEEEYKIEISDSECERLQTVTELVVYLHNKLTFGPRVL
jgi:acyl carrier protein